MIFNYCIYYLRYKAVLLKHESRSFTTTKSECSKTSMASSGCVRLKCHKLFSNFSKYRRHIFQQKYTEHRNNIYKWTKPAVNLVGSTVSRHAAKIVGVTAGVGSITTGAVGYVVCLGKAPTNSMFFRIVITCVFLSLCEN